MRANALSSLKIALPARVAHVSAAKPVAIHRYTPTPKVAGYAPDLRTQALKLYADGFNFWCPSAGHS